MPGDGALLATASAPDQPVPSFLMVVGTGAPLTLLAGPATDHPATERAGFDLLDPASVAADPTMPDLRGSFRNVSLLRLPLAPVGDSTVVPGASWAETSCATTPSTSVLAPPPPSPARRRQASALRSPSGGISAPTSASSRMPATPSCASRCSAAAR